MTIRREAFVWNTVFATANWVVVLLTGIVLVPVYLRHIDGATYGAWLASGNILSWIGMIDPGISLVAQQKVAAEFGRKNVSAVGEWSGATILLCSILALLVSVAGIALAPYLATLLKLTDGTNIADLKSAFVWAGLGTAAHILAFGLNSLSLGVQSGLAVGAISTTAQVIRPFAIVLLLNQGLGVRSIGIANMISGAAATIGAGLYLVRRFHIEGIGIRLRAATVRAIFGDLTFTSSLRIGNTAANYFDMFLIARLVGTDAVTILRLTRLPVDMAKAIIQRPASSIQAPLTHLFSEGNTTRAQEVVLRFLKYEIWFLIYIAVGITTFNAAFMRLWVGSEYYGGSCVNMLLVVSLIAEAASMVVFNLLFAVGNIRKNSLALFAYGAIYILLIYILSPLYGVLGVAMAGAASGVMVLTIYYVNALRNAFSFAYADLLSLLLEVLTTTVCCAICAAIVHMINLGEGWAGLTTGVVVFSLCSFVGLVVMSRGFCCEVRNGWHWLRGMVRSKLAT
jgi:O-antigen/teichoic acid export membrane protein